MQRRVVSLSPPGVTVALKLAARVLGGEEGGVDVNAYLAGTCPFEAGTGRPVRLPFQDAMALKSVYDSLVAENAAEAETGSSRNGAERGKPPDFLTDVLRRIALGRDVFSHWREAYPNERLKGCTFDNMWAWMFRECNGVGSGRGSAARTFPDAFDTIEAFVAY